jgi:hypothetical protein
MTKLIITSHELATKLLEGPNLPVFRLGETQDELQKLEPLSYWEKMMSFKGEEPDGEVIVVGAGMVEDALPNPKLRDAAPTQTQTP